MEVQSKEESSKDVQGVVIHTITRQGTEDITPEESARSWRKEHVDGIYTLVEEYVDVSAQQYVGQVDGSTVTEPLETHAYFKDMPEEIKDRWLKWTSGQTVTPANWDPNAESNTLFQTFYQLYKSGKQTYFSPRIVLRMTGVENGPPNTNNVGKIDGGWSAIDGYNPPQNVDFILSAARGAQEGEVWRNTYEWLGSPVGGQGWNTTIYT